jgi:hypothetical protein
VSSTPPLATSYGVGCEKTRFLNCMLVSYLSAGFCWRWAHLFLVSSPSSVVICRMLKLLQRADRLWTEGRGGCLGSDAFSGSLVDD